MSTGAEEIAQLVKYLPYKHKDMLKSLKSMCKKLGGS